MNHYNFDILMNLKNALNVYTNPFEYTKRYGIAILPEKHVTFFFLFALEVQEDKERGISQKSTERVVHLHTSVCLK